MDIVPERQARLIRVFGIVQGVGFRPFVYRLAHEFGLRGWVRNTSGDVSIFVEGDERDIARFEFALVAEAPTLASIERVVSQEATPEHLPAFVIDSSESTSGAYQPVSPDVATCADCTREIVCPDDRRYGYAFTNCTNCGPRYTIIERVPYDRANTTMKAFPMCPVCRREYDDPLDRRFHAQPTACPVCGPHLWLEVSGKRQPGGDDEAIAETARLLLDGRIVAIKGLGGFHLAVDAASDRAVSLLRGRKERPDKALAVMMPDLGAARLHCQLSPEAEAVLGSPASPIVLLSACSDATRLLSRQIAPDNDTLGVMLPYTPLHHLLLKEVDRPLVMTSGNLSEEPLAVDNDEARTRLGGIADAFLMHDRPIHMPCDDSVVSLAGGGELVQVVRRARGYAPAPLRLPAVGPQVLAVGAEMKATVCLARDNLAFLSQHLGELSNYETWEHYLRVVSQLEALFSVHPEAIAHDLHPDYASTAYARERGEREGVRIVGVQHHQAHALSCLIDAGLDPSEAPVLAVVFDGTGYGSDGYIWGGEWLLVEGARCQRLAHLAYMPLVGGEAAIAHVDRLALGYLSAAGMGGLAAELPGLAIARTGLGAHIESVLAAPTTVLNSSMGRLFDAVAGVLGIASAVTYEAQAAIRLETLARKSRALSDCYTWEASEAGEVAVAPLLAQIAEDVLRGVPADRVAMRFHQSVADLTARTCIRLAGETGAAVVALSGGCFQNALLTELCLAQLGATDLRVVIHRKVPCNDGGVSLGQVAAARLLLAEETG